jgi:AcrR family transcriptional regulator
VTSRPTARPSRSERREAIERAATRLFAQRGYAATTVDDIVKAAGLTKPMLYRHFESKQELCIALLERYRDELIAAPLAHFSPSREDRSAHVAEMLDAWLGYIEQHPDAARLLFVPISGDSEVERVQQELHARQRDTQIALLREFVPNLDDPAVEPVGEALRAGLGAVALWWVAHPDRPRQVPARALQWLCEGTIDVVERTER